MDPLLQQFIIAGIVAVPSVAATTGAVLNKVRRHEKKVEEHDLFVREAIDRLARIETKVDGLARK